MNKGYKSLRTAKPVEIGVWRRPHPDPEMAQVGMYVEDRLYERPDEDCRPTHVIDQYEDFDTVGQAAVVKTRELPFEDPNLGAGWVCAGCGEPFGQRIKIRRESVGRPAIAYYTDDPAFKWSAGLMLFCDDEYACGKRAIDRVGDLAKQQLIRTERKKVAEVLDMDLRDIEDPLTHHHGRVLVTEKPPEPQRVCRLQSCKKEFTPRHRVQKYCSSECAAVVNLHRKKSAASKRNSGRPVGRPHKVSESQPELQEV